MIIKNDVTLITLPAYIKSFMLEGSVLNDQVHFTWGMWNNKETFNIGAANSKFKVLSLDNNSIIVTRRRQNLDSCKRGDFSLRYVIREDEYQREGETEEEFEDRWERRKPSEHIVLPLTQGSLICYKEKGGDWDCIIYILGEDIIEVKFNNKNPILTSIEYGVSLELR